MLVPSDAGFDRVLSALSELGEAPIILDLGTPAAYRKELEVVRGRFKGKLFTLDGHLPARPGEAPTVQGDLHAIPFRERAASAVILKDVLEHVRSPQTVAREVYRVLRNGGRVVSITPWLHPYHGNDQPFGKDYWRFSPDALRVVFSAFKDVHVERLGGPGSITRNYLSSGMASVLTRRPLANVLGWVDSILPTRHVCSAFLLTATK